MVATGIQPHQLRPDAERNTTRSKPKGVTSQEAWPAMEGPKLVNFTPPQQFRGRERDFDNRHNFEEMAP